MFTWRFITNLFCDRKNNLALIVRLNLRYVKICKISIHKQFQVAWKVWLGIDNTLPICQTSNQKAGGTFNVWKSITCNQ